MNLLQLSLLFDQLVHQCVGTLLCIKFKFKVVVTNINLGSVSLS